MHNYSLLYRPPGITLPKGWVLVERPWAGLGFDKRTDLPLSRFRFGVIAYSRPLSDDEIKAFELQPV